MSSHDHITETRWSWLWYFIRWCAYAEPRPTTPREMELLDVIAERDHDIAAITATLDEVRKEQANVVAIHRAETDLKDREIEKLGAEIEVLKRDVDLMSELHEKTMNRIKAESAAYAARIPAEAK